MSCRSFIVNQSRFAFLFLDSSWIFDLLLWQYWQMMTWFGIYQGTFFSSAVGKKDGKKDCWNNFHGKNFNGDFFILMHISFLFFVTTFPGCNVKFLLPFQMLELLAKKKNYLDFSNILIWTKTMHIDYCLNLHYT